MELPFTKEELLKLTRMLIDLAEKREVLDELSAEDRIRLLKAAGDLYCPDIRERRRLLKARSRSQRKQKIDRDQETLKKTGIRVLRTKPIFTTPHISVPRSSEVEDKTFTAENIHVADAQNCYICKRDFKNIHHFYDQLCLVCAEFNFRKRGELADLKGRVALLTGGRVKIGYQAGIKLLRSGVQLIVTTRFPRDSAERYAREPDFEEWKDRLQIFGLDLRHTPSVENFCNHLMRTTSRLDFIINNACQTVRRPPEFYKHMMDKELALLSMPSNVRRLLDSYSELRFEKSVVPGEESSHRGLVQAPELSQIRMGPETFGLPSQLFPEGELDQDLQQIDLRQQNSWRLLMAEVSTVELLEVQLVNAIAPYILNARLKSLMLRTQNRDKHIVNVSAVEGQFYRRFKTTRHPHTNMAKAALNMMTRTAATDYFNDGIHMNAVDTGWVTDEDPAQLAEKKILEHRFHPPLDIVDGAARIVDPIIDGINTGQHLWGKFLKDYRPTDW